MSHTRWRRHRSSEHAVDAILDAAGQAFGAVGVANATMVDIARAAGCSRATLYRYFANQDALHLAYVHRATLRIAHRLAQARQAGAPGSLADRIVAGIAAVRDDPSLAVWFEPENMAVPIRVSQSSELLRAMSVGLVHQLGADEIDPDEIVRRGEWLLRCIISLLAMPGPDPASELAMVESFVIPVLLSELPLPKANS